MQSRINEPMLRKSQTWSYFIFGLLLLPFLLSCAAYRPQVQPEPGPALPGAANAITGVNSLAQALETVLSDSILNQATVGLKVVRLRDGAVLFDKNSDKLFHPASNMKLFTSAAALLHLGPNYRFVTRIAVDSAAIIADTLKSNVYLLGSGNPDFSIGDLASLIEQLYSLGIRYIDGDLICDDFLFDDLRFGNGWMWDEGSSEDFAQVSALTIQDNTVRVFASPADSVGEPARIRLLPVTSYMQVVNNSLTIDRQNWQSLHNDSLFKFEPLKIERRWQTQENIIDISGMLFKDSPEYSTLINVVDPTHYFGTLFKEACERQGIGISGAIVRGPAPAAKQVIARHVSPSLLDIVIHLNKTSDNLSAEQLLKTVGARVKGAPGTAEKGLAVIKETLAGWGADTTSLQFADGSGVSRYNLVSPRILISLLVNMYQNFKVRSEFIASLPIAGVDGTLSSRMRDLAAFGVVHAKTGSLNGVSTLGGYTQSRDGEVLAFSIMMSNFVAPPRLFRRIQDKICDVLTRFQYLPATD